MGTLRADRLYPVWCDECQVYHFPSHIWGMVVIACPSMSEDEITIRQPPKIDRNRLGGQEN